MKLDFFQSFNFDLKLLWNCSFFHYEKIMRFKDWPQVSGAGRGRAGHHHGSHTPTSPEAVLLHSSLLGCIDIWVTLYNIQPEQKSFTSQTWKTKKNQGRWNQRGYKQEGRTENLLGPDNNSEFLKEFMNILLKN